MLHKRMRFDCAPLTTTYPCRFRSKFQTNLVGVLGLLAGRACAFARARVCVRVCVCVRVAWPSVFVGVYRRRTGADCESLILISVM